MEFTKMSTRQIKKDLNRLENKLDKITSNYEKAQATLDEIHKYEAELDFRLNRR